MEHPDESSVHAIWCDILGLHSLSATDNFIDVGGTSITAEMIASRLRSRYDLDVSGSEVLRIGTVRGITELLSERAAAGGAARTEGPIVTDASP